jgi:hypothetical protein
MKPFLYSLIILFITGSYFQPISSASQVVPDEGTIIYLPAVYRDYDPSWSWNEPVMLTLSPEPFDPPLLVIDNAGRPHIIWDTLSSPRYIFHTYLSDSGWTPPNPIATSLGASETLFPPIIDTTGTIHLLWHNDLGTGITEHYRLIYAFFDGALWSSEEEVIRSEWDIQGWVHLDDQGGVHVTSEGSIFGTIHFMSRTNDGWTLPIELDPVHSVSLVWPDMFGGVHFYGSSYYPEWYIHHSYWHDGAFVINDQVAVGQLGSHDTQIDSLGNLHQFWRGQVPVPGGTVMGIYYRCLDSNLVWGPESNPSGQAEVSSALFHGWDQLTHLALAWKEAVSGQVRLGVWNGCTQIDEKTVPFPGGTLRLEPSALAIRSNPNMICALAETDNSGGYVIVCATVTDW